MSINSIIDEIDELNQQTSASLKRLIAAYEGRAIIADMDCRPLDAGKFREMAREKKAILNEIQVELGEVTP